METPNINIGDGATYPNGNGSVGTDVGIETLEAVQKLPHLSFLTYAKMVEPLGQMIQDKTGILKIVPIIQSAHESAFGNSGLARQHGNLFGIVATDHWKAAGGAIADMPTFEYVHGVKTQMKREFRAYRTWRESFADWAQIITGLSIYLQAYECMKHRDTVREGIALMARYYATDPKYGDKLTALLDVLL